MGEMVSRGETTGSPGRAAGLADCQPAIGRLSLTVMHARRTKRAAAERPTSQRVGHVPAQALMLPSNCFGQVLVSTSLQARGLNPLWSLPLHPRPAFQPLRNPRPGLKPTKRQMQKI